MTAIEVLEKQVASTQKTLDWYRQTTTELLASVDMYDKLADSLSNEIAGLLAAIDKLKTQ